MVEHDASPGRRPVLGSPGEEAGVIRGLRAAGDYHCGNAAQLGFAPVRSSGCVDERTPARRRISQARFFAPDTSHRQSVQEPLVGIIRFVQAAEAAVLIAATSA